ncbi:gag polyprotein [Fusarium flagelliforme]|uniref:Gag polyprotein n=1 Tax=Fusarium flagelliforme TaxID=2675880 RepID=A0A395MAL6_9HYPO|nr:gag polyprotein [Fusarium flagelliforme]
MQYGNKVTKHQKAQAWKQKHDYDKQWAEQTDEVVRRAKERAKTVQDDDVYIRAITAEQEQNPASIVQRPMAYSDLRRYPNSPKHNQISWMSCTAHYCALHRQEKISNNCFPLSIKNHVYQRPYTIIDTVGYRLSEQHLENEVMKFTAYTETRERALAHIQNRRSIDQWKHRVKSTTPVNLRTREEDDERLIRKWQQDTKGDPDRGDTPDPETLRQ